MSVDAQHQARVEHARDGRLIGRAQIALPAGHHPPGTLGEASMHIVCERGSLQEE